MPEVQVQQYTGALQVHHAEQEKALNTDSELKMDGWIKYQGHRI